MSLIIFITADTVFMSVYHIICVEVREQFAGVSSLLQHVGPGNWTQIVRIDGNHFYPLSHFVIKYFIYIFKALNQSY